MVVFQDGKPLKSAYKRFKVEGLTDQDDYASMHQVLLRRLTHYVQQDTGFAERPDVLLIDGGIEHARVAEDVLQTLGLSIPTYGMVKDDRHRTRALVTRDSSRRLSSMTICSSRTAVFERCTSARWPK